jgi:hypothetical protein
MTDISYRVVPRGKGSFDVEMDKPDGRKQTVPGFRSEHEAEAWIVQAKRMIRDAGPWTPLAPRKSVPAASSETPKATPAEAAAVNAPAPVQEAGRAATPRNRSRPARERTAAQG